MIFDMKACGGCRTCELMCSFHHTHDFTPSVSSIVIRERLNGTGFRVELVDDAEGPRMPCDFCRDEPKPFCIQYCSEHDELRKMLDELAQSRASTERFPSVTDE